MPPPAGVIAGKEAGDGLRRTHAMVLAAHAAFPEAARRRAVLEQPALAGRQVGRSIRAHTVGRAGLGMLVHVRRRVASGAVLVTHTTPGAAPAFVLNHGGEAGRQQYCAGTNERPKYHNYGTRPSSPHTLARKP